MKTAQSKQSESKTSVNTKDSNPSRPSFRIVGIGASAGGLEALELVLKQIPANSGMAYVIVQHLDPTQVGMLPELLQRISKMKVLLVTDRMPIEPNHIYVIPPNKTMSILNRKLHLFEPKEARGHRLPIDFFLHSLGDDLREKAVGMILSGMGSDGSSGLKAIKEKNGIALVQSPDTAKYDSMPQNAIDNVYVEIVAPPEELYSRLTKYLHHQSAVILDQGDVKDSSALEKIIILLRTYTGNDFSMYKKNTLYRRIERRMSVHKIDKISSYVHFLQENPKEADMLFRELLIGVTSFFRDAPLWKLLKEVTLPELIHDHQGGPVLRTWITGCSTGEEAFSMAIVFREALESVSPKEDITMSIFATDLDNDAIEKARKGLYTSDIEEHVSPQRLKRFFSKTEDGYRVKTEIRELVIFAQHNVTLHPPFTKIDLLSCRNLLIYLDAELQKKLLGLFYFSMNRNGILVLGGSETLGTQSHLFKAIDSKQKVFKRSEASVSPDLSDFPISFTPPNQSQTEDPAPVHPHQNIQSLADELLLQKFSPIGVLVTETGDVIYTSGRTGKYLEPAVGKANLNIFAMLQEGLKSEFPVAFRRVVTKHSSEVLHQLKVGVAEAPQTIDLHIQWIDSPGLLKGTVMVIFKEVPPEQEAKPVKKSGRKSASQSKLEEELRRSKEEMQGVLEDMQTSQEELKSTNEELQSTNEELQSTNEELTSSKEEMQSLNEELQTLNAELQSKVDDHSRVNSDMKNLLNSTDIATLFLDKDMNIRRFTLQATKIFKLIKSDIGRPFTDQASDLIYPELEEDAQEVLKTLVYIQKQIPTTDGRWYSTRIMPYRTYDDRIDGLVITFINITDLKQLEMGLNQTEKVHNLFLNFSSDVFIKLTPDNEISEFNTQAENFFGVKREAAIKHNFIEQFVSDPEREKAKKALKRLLKKGGPGHFTTKVIAADHTLSDVDCSVQVLQSNGNAPGAVLIIIKQKNK